MNGKWKVATLDARVLSSAMVVVFSNTEFDRKPYAILYLDPTNTYTYTEWKDKTHMENVHSVDWDKDLGKEQSFLGYFSKGDVK